MLVNKSSCSEVKFVDAQEMVLVKDGNINNNQKQKESISLMVQGQRCDANLD